MKLTYKKRLFLWFFVIIAIFTFIMIFVEQNAEKKYRTQSLESELDNYTEIIHLSIEKDSLMRGDKDLNKIENILSILPTDLRLTLIKDDGTVLYDNDKEIQSVSTLKNHLDRPEIMRAFYQAHGSNIRMSSSTEHEYLYYAKYYSKYFVRVALPYNIEVKSVLRPDKMFIYISLGMLVIGLILLNFVAGRFGESISKLKKLATNIKDGKPLNKKINFPDDELGEIGEQLTEIFKQKERHEVELEVEREKIIQHFQFSKNGLCIFNPDKTKAYSNLRFMQYINIITDKLTSNTDILFTDDKFAPIQQFIKDYKKGSKQNYFSYKIVEEGKIFDIQSVVFEDSSFEIAIKDVTEQEQASRLKQEMTNNIAHELRTPVASLRGYLETLDSQTLPKDKQQQFTHRAHVQSIRLSNIVEDIGIISKMEESEHQFRLEKIDISHLINEVRIDLIDKLHKNSSKLNIEVKDSIYIKGNYTLLYSVFRNLIENSIEHGGEKVDIYINNYLEDNKYLYFSYYDTGKGVEEQHLNRIFERFYRADEGRTREKSSDGGSGLGLSIVKNAIKFHHGEIQVKNKKNGGLEFLFTLEK